jgi:hypothetical protein
LLITVVALLSGFAIASAPSVRADVLGFSLPTMDLSAATAEVGKAIAADLTAYLRKALKAPRVSRPRQSPSVSIQAIETVVVVATRLPAQQDVTRTAQIQSDDVRL